MDCKFIACVVGPDHIDPSGAAKNNEASEDELPPDGKTLVLIDQHAADERVRVERFLKAICRGFLSHQEGSGGVEAMQLSPPVPVLLTRHEASRLVGLLNFQKAFESWGFRFSGLEETRARLDCETDLDGGYIQVLVCAIPEIVSEKVSAEGLRPVNIALKSSCSYYWVGRCRNSSRDILVHWRVGNLNHANRYPSMILKARTRRRNGSRPYDGVHVNSST